VDECFRVLCGRRDVLANELSLYKHNQQSKLTASLLSSRASSNSKELDESGNSNSNGGDKSAVAAASSPSKQQQQPAASSSQLRSIENSKQNLNLIDNQSDISSCLDSNYESDNNSVNNLTGNDLTGAVTGSGLGPPGDFMLDKQHEDLLNLEIKLRENFGGRQTKQKTPPSSDESDATLSECAVSSALELVYKKSLSSNSSSNSDKTVAPGSPKTPTPTCSMSSDLSKLNLEKLNLEKTPPSEASASNSNNTNNNNNFKQFSRQLSDGYSSSCTPLSASSINNEQPTVNPFFQSTNTANK
jgi:hypothetical protein